MEVGDLAEDDLDAREYDHVGIVRCDALGVVAVLMEAIRPPHCPGLAHFRTQEKMSRKDQSDISLVKSVMSIDRYTDNFNLHHADGCSNGVADGDTNKIPVLSQST